MKKLIMILFCVVSLVCFAQEDVVLWYAGPAKAWTEALPIGNGRLGAMIYGNPVREELQLNEETIWGGGPHRNDNPKALQNLFSGDRNFLKEYYPVMKGAADFFLDYLVLEPSGKWVVTVPSNSPEHGPMGSNSTIIAGCTMEYNAPQNLYSGLR